MALDALVEVAGAAVRGLGRIAFEIVVELLLYGTGRVLLWPFHRRKPPDDSACALVGVCFWLLVVFALILIKRGASA